MAFAAMTFAACGDHPVSPSGEDPDPIPGTTVDVTPYLGKYLMTRTGDLSISIGTLFTFPLDRDFDVEIVTVKKDPTHADGIVMTSTDGMYLRGTVLEDGLHLENDTIGFAIDTLGIDVSLQMIAAHPVIAAPKNGVLDWTSTVSGTPSVTLPVIGPVTCTITGDLHYHSVLQ